MQVEETDMDAVKMILYMMRQPPPPPFPHTEPPEPPKLPKKKDASTASKKERPKIVLIANHSFIPKKKDEVIILKDDESIVDEAEKLKRGVRTPKEEFQARCLMLRKGQEVILVEGMGELGQWWLGYLPAKPKVIRAFPRSYVRMEKEPAPGTLPPPGTARCIKETPLRVSADKDSKQLAVVEVNQKVQVMQKVAAEIGAVMARVLLLDDEFAEAQALPEPSESEDDSDEEEVEEVLEELIDMVEEVAGVVEALIGNVVVEVEGKLEEREGSLVQTEDGAEVLPLELMDGTDGVGGLIPKKEGGSDDDEEGSGEEEEEEEESDDAESEGSPLATPKPKRVGWAMYCGAPNNEKKKVPGDPNFADRHFTVLLEQSIVGIERFFEGGAYDVTEAKASAMDPVLSAWAARLDRVIERAGVAGVDETGPVMRDARMARAQRAAWVRIAAEAAAEEQALLTDVDKLD